jgi:hypothetical protein
MKFAKLMSGEIISFTADTVDDFIRAISIQERVPIKQIKLFSEEGELLSHDSILLEEVLYNIFIDVNVPGLILNITEGTFFSYDSDYSPLLNSLFEKNRFGSRWLHSDKIIFVQERLEGYVTGKYEPVFPGKR